MGATITRELKYLASNDKKVNGLTNKPNEHQISNRTFIKGIMHIFHEGKLLINEELSSDESSDEEQEDEAAPVEPARLPGQNTTTNECIICTGNIVDRARMSFILHAGSLSKQ